ncbi:MAG: YdeI/OmpD-associated family protein [Anaerolineales bacterium]
MKPAGLAAYKARKGEKSGAYSFEQDEIAPFSAPLERRFKENKAAWNFFISQPPGYQKTLRHWVMSAKQEATQIKRLERIIEVSATKKRVDLMSPFKMTQDQRK